MAGRAIDTGGIAVAAPTDRAPVDAGVLARADTSPVAYGAVLFACTMNVVRSPMAAGILRHLVGRRIYVESAGVREGEIDPFVVAVMDEIGIDVSRHRPRTLAGLHDSSFDLIVTLSPEAQHHALEFTRTMAVDVEYWATFDASLMVGTGSRDQVLGSYRQVRDQLFAKIKSRFALTGSPGV
jgi:protein-tyrosine-phosphatase